MGSGGATEEKRLHGSKGDKSEAPRLESWRRRLDYAARRNNRTGEQQGRRVHDRQRESVTCSDGDEREESGHRHRQTNFDQRRERIGQPRIILLDNDNHSPDDIVILLDNDNHSPDDIISAETTIENNQQDRNSNTETTTAPSSGTLPTRPQPISSNSHTASATTPSTRNHIVATVISNTHQSLQTTTIPSSDPSPPQTTSSSIPATMTTMVVAWAAPANVPAVEPRVFSRAGRGQGRVIPTSGVRG